MMESDDKLMDHNYDGIKELDNDLPGWWMYLFYITIIWSALYMFYYHVFDIGYLSPDEYKKEMNSAYVRPAAENARLLGLLPEYRSPLYNPNGDWTPLREASGIKVEAYVEYTTESDTITYVAVEEASALETGNQLYQKNCAQCHGRLGEGGIGPNLTDSYWIHGGTFSDVVKSVKYGYPAKGMIPWRGNLNPEQIIQVSSHIAALRGTDPPNAKAPQGDLVEM
jgi:cytochrome c oxidase cbb3-type subunit 3